jgi:hypothetical protein
VNTPKDNQLMDTLDLDARLREMGFQPGDYSIGRELDNALILLSEDRVWKVFFFEHGRRLEESLFGAEADACKHMLEKILSWAGKYTKRTS